MTLIDSALFAPIADQSRKSRLRRLADARLVEDVDLVVECPHVSVVVGPPSGSGGGFGKGMVKRMNGNR